MPFILSEVVGTADPIYHFLHSSMEMTLNYVVVMLEWIGLIIIAYSGVKGLIRLFKHDEHVNLCLAHGFSKALEFMLGGEILRTVIVKDMAAIFHVAGIVVLRVALTLLIHWEITTEEKEIENHQNNAE